MLGLFRRKPLTGCAACRALAGDIAALQREVSRLQRTVLREAANRPAPMPPGHIPAWLRERSAG